MLREQIRTIDPNLPVTEARTLDELLNRSERVYPRFSTMLFSVFEGVGMLMAGLTPRMTLTGAAIGLLIGAALSRVIANHVPGCIPAIPRICSRDYHTAGGSAGSGLDSVAGALD